MFDSVNSYYKAHSRIYDLTRWGILFGRNRLLELIPEDFRPERILDLGCGTGKHLIKLGEQFPDANIIGVDASKEMLNKASAKVQSFDRIELAHTSVHTYLTNSDPFDLIVCSYSLSMFGDDHNYLELLRDGLTQNGLVAIVDFDHTPFKVFERWMNLNHVEISGSLFTKLKNTFQVKHSETKSAYSGLWSYSYFVGRQ
jgi:S-adenosylmethionine-diacylgycerolhomoserine-N-methlytransferase